MSSAAIQDQLIDVLQEAHLATQPWSHCYLPATLPVATASSLAGSFTGFTLEHCEETNREKTYRFRTGRVDDLPSDRMPSSEWRSLIGVLTSGPYRKAMSALTGIAVEDCDVTVNAWEYQTGDWLDPHVDKVDKVVTHILYFTSTWREANRGRLLILGSSDPASVVRALPPALGSSAILVRSDRSWHAVEAPASLAPYRRTVTVTFWR